MMAVEVPCYVCGRNAFCHEDVCDDCANRLAAAEKVCKEAGRVIEAERLYCPMGQLIAAHDAYLAGAKDDGARKGGG
jgi:hypothetical protein